MPGSLPFTLEPRFPPMALLSVPGTHQMALLAPPSTLEAGGHSSHAQPGPNSKTHRSALRPLQPAATRFCPRRLSPPPMYVRYISLPSQPRSFIPRHMFSKIQSMLGYCSKSMVTVSRQPSASTVPPRPWGAQYESPSSSSQHVYRATQWRL